jgi:hypothetical protein
MVVLANYEAFNPRRYGNPWVAKVNHLGKIDFSEEVGAYTGSRGSGEAGQLYVYSPAEGQVYAYGQKDYRGHHGGCQYVVFLDGVFVPLEKTDLVRYF